MILLKLIGTTTLFLSDVKGGYDLQGQFYEPLITSVSNISITADPIERVENISLTLDREAGIALGNYASYELTLVGEDEIITIPNGTLVQTRKDATGYKYQLKSENNGLDVDLLSSAPDLKVQASDASTFNENRVYPLVLGNVKHVEPLQLTQEGTGVYYTGTTVEAIYDGGIALSFEQQDYTGFNNKAVKTPLNTLTADLQGQSSMAVVNLTEKQLYPDNYMFIQTTEPSASTIHLKEGMQWFDTHYKTYTYTGLVWSLATDVTPDISFQKSISLQRQDWKVPPNSRVYLVSSSIYTRKLKLVIPPIYFNGDQSNVYRLYVDMQATLTADEQANLEPLAIPVTIKFVPTTTASPSATTLGTPSLVPNDDNTYAITIPNDAYYAEGMTLEVVATMDDDLDYPADVWMQCTFRKDH